MDVEKLADIAGKGLPDKAIAVLMDCDVNLFGKWPHLRKCIDRARADLQLELATTFVNAAKGTAAVPPTSPEAKDGVRAIEPDMKSADTLLNRLGFFDAPLDTEVKVTVVWDEEPPEEGKAGTAPTKKRTPVDMKRVVGAAVAIATASRIATAPNGNGNGKH
jgi:hypothetical protein